MGRRLLLGVLILVGTTSVQGTPADRVPSANAARSAQSESQTGEVVSFNVKSLKFHCRTCLWAKRCTANCVDVRVSEAKRRGGLACKVCGGSCRR